MIFEVSANNTIGPVASSWRPTELEVERLIIPAPGEMFDEQLFQEELLYLGRQWHVGPYRLDILAIDRQGRAVVIELKRDEGALGVEMQALTYLAGVSTLRGEDFVRQVCQWSGKPELEEAIQDFVEVERRAINAESRIMVIARAFDPALYSMARWLAGKGVGFKCLQYSPMEISSRRFLAFSIAFNASDDEQGSLAFRPVVPRSPAIFWHNIGINDETWWRFIADEGIITANYDNVHSVNCRGYKKLSQYIKGDKIVAFASGVGVVGWGIIENKIYEYVDHEQPMFAGLHFHRLAVAWKAVLPFSNAIPVSEVRERFQMNHPSGTKQEIQTRTAEAIQLMQLITQRCQRAA